MHRKSQTKIIDEELQTQTNELLDGIVYTAINTEVKSLYLQLVEMLKCKLHIDVNIFFRILAAMTLIVWVERFYRVAKKLFCFTIPNIVKRLLKGKISFSEFVLSSSTIGTKHYKSKKSSSSSSDHYIN